MWLFLDTWKMFHINFLQYLLQTLENKHVIINLKCLIEDEIDMI